jgi:hypothetical protein
MVTGPWLTGFIVQPQTIQKTWNPANFDMTWPSTLSKSSIKVPFTGAEVY